MIDVSLSFDGQEVKIISQKARLHWLLRRTVHIRRGLLLKWTVTETLKNPETPGLYSEKVRNKCLRGPDYSPKHKSIEKLTANAPQPFYNVFLFLRTFCIVWNLVRRRVTRRLTRLQTMYNVLKYSKTWCENDDISIYRYRTGTGNKFNLIMRMTVLSRL